ncbi:MFS transporter [Xanthomonas melonis]|jgi:MFS family permease|uniref:MFS transporter n=1 Tax=Xanthomonas melonis TaxID=56456 RepID=UPI003EBBC0C4
MHSEQKRAVWLLGLCQCILWGVLYYSFSVFLVPLEHALATTRTVVAGAFSVGLIAMASVAPLVGRWLDEGHAGIVTRWGLCLAIAGLLLLGLSGSVMMLYAAWLLIGIAMALLLYEPAFILVMRAILEPGHRLRALAAVTIMGGLASTVFLPLTSYVIGTWGWRIAALSGVGALLLVACLMEGWVVPALPAIETRTAPRWKHKAWPRHMPSLAMIFSIGSLASITLTTLLIPFLMERGVSAETAAIVLAAFGAAQLPGRIWLLRKTRALSQTTLTTVPIVLMVTGMLGVTLAHGPGLSLLAVSVFGLGAGLQTLAKPWLVQAIYGNSAAGQWNGEIARVQGFARALTPVAVASVSLSLSIEVVLVVMVVLLAATVPVAHQLRAAHDDRTK